MDTRGGALVDFLNLAVILIVTGLSLFRIFLFLITVILGL